MNNKHLRPQFLRLKVSVLGFPWHDHGRRGCENLLYCMLLSL